MLQLLFQESVGKELLLVSVIAGFPPAERIDLEESVSLLKVLSDRVPTTLKNRPSRR
jgi:hypothetical protein